MKSIHIKKLWSGAVISFKAKGDNGYPPVYYHVDYIDNKYIHYTAIHTDVSYKSYVQDRYVWLRS